MLNRFGASVREMPLELWSKNDMRYAGTRFANYPYWTLLAQNCDAMLLSELCLTVGKPNQGSEITVKAPK